MTGIKTELLAPVGSSEMLQAAIHNGADSVYIGVPEFNARGRSRNFSDDELADLIGEAHLYGLRVYLAFNILIFEDELEEAYDLFVRLSALSPDAWIIQDPGLAQMANASGLKTALHASTQMTAAGERDVSFYSDLSFKRFTLARELSFEEIARIRERVSAELECFVHGSLCISYSGQCMTSSGFGGRSANRGECAQSCRHPYDLYVDDSPVKTPGPFLVSPQDLNGRPFAERLKEIHINALKIEGRLKTPEYVSAACRSYTGRGGENESILTFERGYSPGWLSGFNSKKLVDESFNSHTGIEIGIVKGVEGRDIFVEKTQDAAVNPGDGFFMPFGDKGLGASVRNTEDDGRVIKIYPGKEFPFEKVKPGMRFFISSSKKVDEILHASYHDLAKQKKIPVDFRFSAEFEKPLLLEAADDDGNAVQAIYECSLERSKNRPCTEEDAKKELGALSRSPFYLRNIETNLESGLFIPNQFLKSLRHDVTEKLEALRKKRNPAGTALSYGGMQAKLNTSAGRKKDASRTDSGIRLNILLRDPDAVAVIGELPEGTADCVYLEFEYGRHYDEALENLRSCGVRTGIALPRVMKTGEEKTLDFLISKKPDVLLVRNAGSLHYLMELDENARPALIGDFSLNITNSVSAGYYLNKGLDGITSSYDFIDEASKNDEISRLISFLEHVNPETFEFILSYYLPSFYMEYCPYAHHLGRGGDYKTCGLPCKNHMIYLKDRVGEKHPVLTDQNCRNTMFNGKRRDLSRHIARLKKMGVRNFRIESLRDTDVLYENILKIRSMLDEGK